MALSSQLILNDKTKVIGFTGGKGRDYLVRHLADELVRSGKKVVISHLKNNLLPVSGHIVYKEDTEDLIDTIESVIKDHSLVYAGRNMIDHLLQGIHLKTAQRIAKSSGVDYLFFIIGSNDKYSILSSKEISKLSKISWMNELIYCFQFDLLDTSHSLSIVQNAEELAESFSQFASHKVLDHKLIVEYMKHPEKGALPLFQQSWPTLLIFTDTSSPFLENRAINLARDLSENGIQHIYSANLKENLIKKISSN